MPARLSDALPRASSCAAAAEYSAPSPAASLREPPPPHRQAPHHMVRPGTVTNRATPHEPGRGQCKAATTQGTTRSCQQGAKPLPSTAGLLPHCYPTRYPAPRKLTE
jgi:hypothetical protein